MSRVQLATLKLDYTLYPRSAVDSTHVREIAEAVRAGVQMPPLIADKDSRRLVDGYHRYHAYKSVYHEEVETDVEFRSYDSNQDFFLDAVRLNAGHGRRLSPFEKVGVVVRAQELSIDPKYIAAALNVTPEWVGQRVNKRVGYRKGGEPVVLKTTMQHLAGKTLTEKQEKYNRKAGGMRPLYYINQVAELLTSDSIDPNNTSIIATLLELQATLSEWLEERPMEEAA